MGKFLAEDWETLKKLKGIIRIKGSSRGSFR